MKTRVAALRGAALAACLLTLAAACTSAHGASKPSGTSAATSTTDPNETPNSIPYVVGEKIGLPNGWLVTVLKVHRPYPITTLPTLPAGKEYIRIDLAVENEGPATRTVNAEKVFWVGDSTGKVDRAVPVPGHPSGLEGSYPANVTRTGQLVFPVPSTALLRMTVDGPLIGTQQSVWTIYPPTVAPDQS